MDSYELRQCVELALELIDRHPTIVAAEVYASWEEQQSAPIQYHTAQPEAAAPLPHTQTACGLSMLVELSDKNGTHVGFHSDEVDFSYESITRILENAIQSGQPGTLGYALPRPGTIPAPTTSLYDAELLSLAEDEVVHMANEALEGALTTLKDVGYGQEIRIQGEVSSRKTHVAVGNTQELLACDTATTLVATVHIWLGSEACWGSHRRGTAYQSDFSAYDVGAAAAQQALQMRGARVMPAGAYPVILGPQAVASLLYDLWLPVCSLDTLMHDAHPLAQLYGQSIVSPLLSLVDEARLPGYLGSRTITDEGIPTGSTTLIERGRLVNFLADLYQTHRYAMAPSAFMPHNGWRCAVAGHRFATRPGIFPTNLTLSGTQTMPLEELLAPIAQGIYVGDLWSTVTPHGIPTGAFTSTVIGPSFAIEHGKLSYPIQPATLQLQDNFIELFQRCTGVSNESQAIVLPTQQAVAVSPELRCSVAHFVAKENAG